MSCDYYIKSTLVIEYLNIDLKLCKIYTNIEIKKGYVYKWEDYDSDDDFETSTEKYNDEIRKKIKENTYDKMLYKNGKWLKASYQKKYEEYIMRNHKEIYLITKVYKRNNGVELHE